VNKIEYSSAFVFDAVTSKFEKMELSIPSLKEGEILVKNEYVTLCRSDLNTFSGKRKEKNPTILGHEIIGRVALIHDTAIKSDLLNSELRIGDRITWGIYSSDPNSFYSRIGIPQKGSDLFKYGHEELKNNDTLHGGLADYIILRKNTPIIKIDENIPLSIAATINCAVATVSGAFRIAEKIEGKRILIIGVGMLGIIACAMAKSRNAKFVAAADNNETRLNLSYKFGAEFSFNTTGSQLDEIKNNGQKYDIVFDFSGSPDAMELSLELLDIGGSAIWVGATFSQRNLNISAEKLIRNIHTIKGLHNYNQNDLITAVIFIKENYNKFPFQELVEDLFSLEQTPEAFNYALTKNPFRVGIRIS